MSKKYLTEEKTQKYAGLVRKYATIDNELYSKYNVKRGLRNADGTGVLVGLTTVGEVTGYIVVDNEITGQTHTANQHYISLDETTLFHSLKGTENEITNTQQELTLNGGKIVTIDNNIYLVGYTDRGTLNMVYTFLAITFNWECYSANTIVMDEGLENLKLRNYQVTDIPDVEYQPTSGYEKAKFVVCAVRKRDMFYVFLYKNGGCYK